MTELPPHVPTDKPPALDDIENDLRRVLRKGLPLTPSLDVPALLALRGVWARAVDPTDPLARLDAADRLIRAQLRRFGLDHLREAAIALFGMAGTKGQTLTQRRAEGAAGSGYEVNHFRKRVEPAILAQLAWQLHQDSLQYVPRGRKVPPAEASGDTPTISEEHLATPERAEHEILLSRIWSAVYGLRAELIATELHRGRSAARSSDAAVSAERELGRLLLSIDEYMDTYGHLILHGEAEFNAEALIRLAGWTASLTDAQAKELRWRARRENTRG